MPLVIVLRYPANREHTLDVRATPYPVSLYESTRCSRSAIAEICADFSDQVLPHKSRIPQRHRKGIADIRMFLTGRRIGARLDQQNAPIRGLGESPRKHAS